MKKWICLMVMLLISSCSEAGRGQFVLHSEPEKDGSHDLKLVERERMPDKSVIRVEVTKRGASVADSMFVVCGMASLTKERGFRYFKKVRESQLSAGEWEYETVFYKENPNDKEAMDAGEFSAVCR